MKRALLALLVIPSYCYGQALDITAPQVRMHERITAAVERSRQELGLSSDVLTYCRIELNNHTGQLPQNGSIPFGVDYRRLSTQEELDTVIRGREAYEKTYLLLCLAKAKRDLSLAQ